MKKTTLILFTSVACISLSACYSTPEMDELRYRTAYEDIEEGCNAEADYMHEGLRNCIEARMAYDDENKKTVTIVPTKTGTLVIPKTYDDETMMDTSRIYERVDINDHSVVIEEGVAPRMAAVTTETTTIIEVEKTKKEAAKEEKKAEPVKEEAVEEEPEEEVIEEPIEEPVEEEVIEETIEESVEEAEPEVVTQTEEFEEPEEEAAVVSKVVSKPDTVLETEIISEGNARVEAKVVAEPETVIEIEKKNGDVEVKKTIKFSDEKIIEKKQDAFEKKTEVISESKKIEAKPIEVVEKADSDANRKVTVVLKPSADDVIVSVDLSEQSKKEVKPEPVKKVKTVKAEKKKEVAVKKEKTKIFKKNEKELLPTEEK